MDKVLQGFSMISKGIPVPLLVEAETEEGIIRIFEQSAADIEAVCGTKPKRIFCPDQAGGSVVLFATVGRSPLISELEEHGKFSTSELSGKREIFKIQLVSEPWPGVPQALIVCGSDKRGTIYGIFYLSEWLGVSPWIYWGDVMPEQKTDVFLDESINFLSKEPSVKYRGFFINDEWPCFGNWAVGHFHGFTAELYEKVFILLLRLKGNYLWPAMWSSSFPLDGPGLENAKLADLYGIVMGTSHHEPCLRASEEWDLCRGSKSIYGNQWNYIQNKEGLLHYWKDGLKRSGSFEAVITIGMRGERDSSMLGPEASLAENIGLLKDIITEQKKLISQYVNPDLNQVPMLLAAYKEVEQYYQGDNQTPGLKDWDGLDGVTILYCEDNFGNLRTLPEPSHKDHKGGYGMYYHLDYHGGPISYEWVASTPLYKIWDQMKTAYENGIQELWIVNVGDLKFQEYPLNYFMELAYDFDTWGGENQPSYERFTKEFILKQFGTDITEEQSEKIFRVLEGYLQLNYMRRPEALNSEIYHPCHYREADRMLQAAKCLEEQVEELKKELCGRAARAFYSMIYYPAAASLNLLQMQLYAGKNRHYAAQGKTVANLYADKIKQSLKRDRMLAKDFAEALEGKWSGMEKASHIGFVTWNEDGCRYPLRTYVEPADKPRLIVSRCDKEEIYTKTYGAPAVLSISDFTDPGICEVVLELANDGTGVLNFDILGENCDWLVISKRQGSLIGSDPETAQTTVTLQFQPSGLKKDREQTRLTIQGGDTTVEVLVIATKPPVPESEQAQIFYPVQEVTVIEAEHFTEKRDMPDGAFTLLRPYGRSGSGMKVFPSDREFEHAQERPQITYSVYLPAGGAYLLEIWTSPCNPPYPGKGIRFLLSINEESDRMTDTIPEGFDAGNPGNQLWAEGVLNNIRKTVIPVTMLSGVNRIRIGAVDPGFILERLLLYPVGKEPEASYLGPLESYHTMP